MISKNKKPISLPADAYLASMLGLTNEEYQWFKSEAYRKNTVKPGQVTAGLETLAILSGVFSLISIGLAVAASFFKPREGTAGQVRTSNVSAENITGNQRFSPRFGFDSVQAPAVLGSTIPLVYANAVEYSALNGRPAGRYGGVRVSPKLVWSQMKSLGGDQFFQSLYAVGESDIQDIESLAIGDNSISSIEFQSSAAMQQAAKFTIYYRGSGGRITSSDYRLGRLPQLDPGNAQEAFGAPDVYCIKSSFNEARPDFCFTTTPSNGNTFGLSDWLANGMFFRVNPTIRATGSIEKISRSNGEEYKVQWVDDFDSVANMWKQRYHWSYRCGVISPTGNYNVNDTFQYVIYSNSDAKTVIFVNGANAKGSSGEDGPSAYVGCSEISSAIAAYQSSAADGLIEGELYKFGSALAVLVGQSPENVAFASDDTLGESKGQTITYTFRVVRAGYIENGGEEINPSWSNKQTKPDEWAYYAGEGVSELEALPIPSRWKTASARSQGFKCTTAAYRMPRPCRVFEIGLRSTVGIKVNGLCNFRNSYRYNRANDMAGGRYNNSIKRSSENLQIQNYSSGFVESLPEYRYSFWKILLKNNDTDQLIEIPATFAVRSNTGQPVYNYIRIDAGKIANWEFSCEPITSWELRSGRTLSPHIVLDYKIENEKNYYFSIFNGISVYWTGEIVENSVSTFELRSVEKSKALGLGWSDGNGIMTDAYGKVAEAFCFGSIDTTVSQGPEHTIKYVNIVTENQSPPDYHRLALLGFNTRAGRLFSQLNQVSVFVPRGRKVKRLLHGDSDGPSNLFPDVFRDIILSGEFGMGDTFSEEQIGKQSFIDSAFWNLERRYFFDGVITEKVNLRQWGADVAATMLLELYDRDGRFELEPAVRFPSDGPVPISGLFTAGNIIENSFSLEVLPEEDRSPIRVAVKWRQERAKSNYLSSGYFSLERTVVVMEVGTDPSAPLETFENFADYGTNEEHAIDFGCFACRARKLLDHTIQFSTTIQGIDAGLKAGDFIKVALDFEIYNEFSNGVILANGTIVSTSSQELVAGSYAAFLWNGMDETIDDSQIAVDASGKADKTNCVFALKNTTSSVRVYKIEKIDLGENGSIDIRAVHHPVDEAGISLIGKNWTTYQTDGNWIIQKG